MNQQNSENSGLSEMTSGVNTVTEPCHPAGMGGENTVTMLAERPHIVKGKRDKTSELQRDAVTLTNTKPHKRAKKSNYTIRTVTLKFCEYCEAEYTTPRPSQSRFCSANCRRNGWLVNNPDKAAVLAERDKARLKAHLESKGVVWVDKAQDGR